MSVITDSLEEEDGKNDMKHTNEQIRTAIHAGTFTPADQAWHDIRQTGITGTEVAAIMGLSPYSSAYKIWAIKTNRIDGHVPQNRPMRLGQLIEPALLQMFTEEHPEMAVIEVGTYKHVDHPELVANPDAIAYEGDKLWIVEIKTARQYWETVPEHYIRQTWHYADVFGADGIKVISYAGGIYTEWEVPFTADELKEQRKTVLHFWNELVQKDVEPDWDTSDATYEVVRHLAKPGDPEVSIDLGYLGVQLSNAQRNYDEAKGLLTQLKSATLAQMGDSKYAITSEGDQTTVVAVKRERKDRDPWLEVK